MEYKLKSKLINSLIKETVIHTNESNPLLSFDNSWSQVNGFQDVVKTDQQFSEGNPFHRNFYPVNDSEVVREI